MSVAADSIEHTYQYRGRSTFEPLSAEAALSLATSGGCSNNPHLATGFVDNATQAARALVVVGEAAATRFWTPPNMVAAAIRAADPVVTTHEGGIRFESFSLCGGVYTRFDLRADSFDGDITQHGTTNIDMGRDLKRALSQVSGADPLKLTIGQTSVEVATLTGQVVERKIPLPERWIRGFASSALAISNLEPKFTLTGGALRRFIQEIPNNSSTQNLWAVPSGPVLRLTSRPQPNAIAANDIERLNAFRSALPYLKSATAYGPAAQQDGATAWVADLSNGQLTIALSPTASRGFSGEGSWLLRQARNDPELAQHINHATAGRRGFDLHHQAWFQRDLPYDRAPLKQGAKRLADARKLADAEAVTHHDDRATIQSGQNEYSGHLIDQTCTCPWWGKHQGTRGPCKHLLAAILTVT